MKILLVCDFKGVLGAAGRTSAMSSFLQKEHTVKVVNLAEHYASKVQVLARPDVVMTYIAKSAMLGELSKYYAYRKLARDVVLEEIDSFKPDVVLASSLNHGGAIAKVCEDKGIPLVTDVQGVQWAEYEENTPMNPSQTVVEHLKELEKEAITKSALLLSVSNSLKKYLTSKGATSSKVVVAMNGANLQNNVARFSKNANVVYAGSLSHWENIDAYLDFCKVASPAKCVIAGDGQLKADVEKRIAHEKIGVDFKGKLSEKELSELLSVSTIGVVPSTNTLSRQVAMPIKIFTYAAAGLPVVAPSVGEWSDLVKKEDFGVITRESNGVEFKEAVDELSNEKVWKEKSKNALDAIKTKYNWNKTLASLKELESLK